MKLRRDTVYSEEELRRCGQATGPRSIHFYLRRAYGEIEGEVEEGEGSPCLDPSHEGFVQYMKVRGRGGEMRARWMLDELISYIIKVAYPFGAREGSRVEDVPALKEEKKRVTKKRKRRVSKKKEEDQGSILFATTSLDPASVPSPPPEIRMEPPGLTLPPPEELLVVSDDDDEGVGGGGRGGERVSNAKIMTLLADLVKKSDDRCEAQSFTVRKLQEDIQEIREGLRGMQERMDGGGLPLEKMSSIESRDFILNTVSEALRVGDGGNA